MWLALAACRPEESLVRAPEDPTLGSLVWLAVRDGEVVFAHADEPGSNVQLDLREGDIVTVLTYTKTLAELNIPSGVILPSAEGSARGFPAETKSYTARLSAGGIGAGAWTAGEPSPAVRSFKYSQLSTIECVELGGCYPQTTVDLAGNKICAVPCPEPPAPMRPAQPQPVILNCTAPWERHTVTSTLSFCAPRVGDCPGEREVYFPSGRCAAIGRPCPPDGEYADGLPPEAIFVRRSAPAGGDGSRGAPYSSITEALSASANTGTVTLALAAENLVHGDILGLERNRTLIGACPEKSILTGPIGVARGRTTFSNLQISSSVNGVLISPHAHGRIEDSVISSAQYAVSTLGSVEVVECELTGGYGGVASNPIGSGHTSVEQVIVHGGRFDGMIFTGGHNATFSVQGAIIAGAHQAAGIALNDARGMIDGAEIHDFAQGITVGAGTASIAHVRVENTQDGILVAELGRAFGKELVVARARTVALRIWGFGEFEQAALLRGEEEAVQASMTGEVVLRDSQVIDNHGFYAITTNVHSKLTLQRVALINPMAGGISVREGSDVRLNDVSITSDGDHLPNANESSLQVVGNMRTMVTGERLFFSNPPSHGIETARRGVLILSDLTIEKAQNRSIELSENVVAELHRVTVSDGEGDDLSVSEDAVVNISDLLISGRQEDTFGARAALDLSGTGALSISVFELRGKAIGVEVRDQITLKLSKGRIGLHPIDIQVRASREADLIELLDGVVFEGGIINVLSGN